MDSKNIKPGIEVFLDDHVNLVKGKKVGLVTNPTGVNSRLKSTAEIFVEHPDIDCVALYGPEHGVRGDIQAGEAVPFYMDRRHNLPVFSLYGQSVKTDPKELEDMDSRMRSFDTQETGKNLEKGMIRNIEIMVFDMQDVGTRIYTYIATMAYCMQVCARNGIDFIVLDRPNPINGLDMEGPLLEYPDFSSFVGLYPVPVRHGMTVGELALLFNEKYLNPKVHLKVIPMQGWERPMWFDETGLPWVIPSPNLPTLLTATVYPGQVFLEGTNVSEGRGTTRPFELFGAPWIDGYGLAKRLNPLDLPGVRFREASFSPAFSKYRGELCGGCQVHIEKREKYRPLQTALAVIMAIHESYRENFEFHSAYFDKIMGTARVRKSIERGEGLERIVSFFLDDVEKFKSERKPYLLY